MPSIASIEVRASAPDVERFRYTSTEDEVYTTTTLVRITDDAGTVGLGAYDSDSFGDWDRSPLETLRTIVPRLIGTDPDDVDSIQATLTEDGTSPFAPAVRSAIDIACWDMAARRAGQPLHRRLGGDGTVTGLPSYASVPTLGDDRSYLGAIEDLVERGFTAIKVHAWGDPSRDADLLRTVRGRFDSLVIMHDAEGRYDRDGALFVARACADVGARWFEAPLPDFDLAGYRVFAPTCPASRSFRRAMRSGTRACWPRSCANLPGTRSDSMSRSWGASTPTRALMSVAEDAGLPVELISYGHTVIQAANLHAALAFGRTSYFEQAVPPEPFEHGVVRPLRTGLDGSIEVTDRPGLGIDLDDATLATATLGLVRAGADRPDERTGG